MRTSHAIPIVLLSMFLAGCARIRGFSFWPWGGEKDVPVTRPTDIDANAAEAIAAAPTAETDTQPPAAPPTDPPAGTDPIPPMRPIDKPTRLTDLPDEPIAAPRPLQTTVTPTTVTPTTVTPTAVAPATTPPAVGPATVVSATIPVTAPPSEPPATSPPVTTKPITVSPAATTPPTTAPAPAGGPTGVVIGERPKVIGPEAVVAASAVQVNNRFITVDDILRRLRPRLKTLPKQIPDNVFAQRVAPWIGEEIQSRTVRVLVLDEADKRLEDKQKQMVDVEVRQARNALLAEAGGSKTRLEQMMIERGTTLDEALALHREDAAFRLYLRGRFMPSITITRKMLWDRYRSRRAEFTTGKKVQMQIIAAPLKRFYPKDVRNPSAAERAAARQEAKKTIDEAFAAVQAGRDFAEIAQSHSRGAKAAEGGIWPLMEADNFRETQVEQAAFALPAGQLAGPIETETGYYIVKARRVQPGRTVPFEEAQEKISETLRDEQYNKLTQDYFKTLIDGALIIRSDEFLSFALKRALEMHRKS